MRLFFIMSIAVLISACNEEKLAKLTDIYWEIVQNHYSLPDSVSGKFTVYDSAFIKSEKLSFYRFKVQLLEDKPLWGCIINADGVPLIIDMQKIPHSDLSFDGRRYFNQSSLTGFAKYAVTNIFVGQELQAVLNIIALNKSNEMDRAVLDSFFRIMTFGSEGLNPKKIKLLSKIEEHNFKDVLDAIYEPSDPKTESYNIKYLAGFFQYMKANMDSSNFFAYYSDSYVSTFLLITLNEKFISDSHATQYYKRYSQRKLYDVEVYAPRYLNFLE